MPTAGPERRRRVTGTRSVGVIPSGRPASWFALPGFVILLVLVRLVVRHGLVRHDLVQPDPVPGSSQPNAWSGGSTLTGWAAGGPSAYGMEGRSAHKASIPSASDPRPQLRPLPRCAQAPRIAASSRTRSSLITGSVVRSSGLTVSRPPLEEGGRTLGQVMSDAGPRSRPAALDPSSRRKVLTVCRPYARRADAPSSPTTRCSRRVGRRREPRSSW